MPISRRTLHANAAKLTLRIPQARVLAVLMPDDLSDPTLWPWVARKYLDIRAGYKGKSGTVTRALNGLRKDTRRLLETIILDTEGVKETGFRITAAGITAYEAYIAAHGELPEVRNAANNTYRRVRRVELRVCAQCGGNFPPRRSDAKYCSAACRSLAYYHRQQLEGPT